MRVVTYNFSGAVDSAAIADVLADLAPDIVCAVEVPGRFALNRLARRCDLSVAVRAGGRGQAGVAILVGSEARVRSSSHHQLHGPPGVPNRPAAQAIVGVAGLRVTVVAVQLGLRPEVRMQNIAELEGIVARVDAPAVIAGDFNESPGGALVTHITEMMQDAFAVAGRGRGETYPNPDPSQRKDLVFVDRSLKVVDAYVPERPPVNVASHHRPVVVDLGVPTP